MAEAEVPYSWAGRQVTAAIVEESGYGGHDDGRPLPLTAVHRVGMLEAVNALGIVATLRYVDPKEKGPPFSAFYPWSSVVWLRLVEGLVEES